MIILLDSECWPYHNTTGIVVGFEVSLLIYFCLVITMKEIKFSQLPNLKQESGTISSKLGEKSDETLHKLRGFVTCYVLILFFFLSVLFLSSLPPSLCQELLLTVVFWILQDMR